MIEEEHDDTYDKNRTLGWGGQSSNEATANRVLAELLGPDRNWERLFSFLADRDIMTLGTSSGVDSLEEIWGALTTGTGEGAVSQGQGRQLNLGDHEDRSSFRAILNNPAIFARQFGDPGGYSDDEREAVVTGFIEQTMGKTNFVVVNEMLSKVLAAQESMQPSEEDKELLDQFEGDPLTGEPTSVFFVPTFDGTPGGTINGVGDLLAGLSINPQEVQERIQRLSPEELSAVQLGLWRYGYFTAEDGSVESFSFGEQGSGAYDPTYNAMSRMIFELVQVQSLEGPDVPVRKLLAEKQIQRAKDMAVQYSGTNKAQQEKRALRDSVTREVGQLLIGTGQSSGALSEALALAEEASGVRITAKGRKILEGHLGTALNELGMTNDELEASYAQSQVDDDVEMMLAAYYTDGTFTGDWTESVVMGSNTDADWAEAGLMAGVITEEEARIMLGTADQSPGLMGRERQTIRKKLENNATKLARATMKYAVQNATFAGGGPAGGGTEFDQAAAFRWYGGSVGRLTSQQNRYDRLTYERLVHAMQGSVGNQWLLDEGEGRVDYAGNVSDRIAASAVDALGLPESSETDFAAGGIRSVLSAIAGTGTRSMRRG